MTQSKREREIFDAAMDLPSPEERAAFLRRACGGDGTLLERLNALLRASESAAGFLPEAAGAAPWELEQTRSVEGAGTVIGRYKLLEQIGEGGFGVVYMADQLEPVKRRVALKIIKPGMDSRQVIGRFEAERQALAMMDHPNIAQVFDAGATATGRPYFVMELVRGIPITRFCDEQGLDLEARLKLLIQVCQAVQHAHQKGIIHRDLKPSNLLVALHGEVPVPKVIDFGIAKATEQPLTNRTVFTQFQQFLGTPAYMSPEQAALSGLDIDTRSDIYSLGVLLYELVTGSPPFDAKELLSAGLDEMRRIIREQDPERPSTRLRRTSAPASPPRPAGGPSAFAGDLDWIVLKALEKDRDRRYETANDLAADLQRHLACEPVNARPPSTLYRVQKFTRRHRTLVLSGGAIGLLLVVATVVSSMLAFRLHRSNLQVIRESDASAAMLGFFTHDLMGQEGVPRNGLQDLKLRDAAIRAAASLGTRFPDRPDIERRIRIQLGDIFRSLGEQREAREEYRKALALPVADEVHRGSKDRVVLLKAIADCSFELQDYPEAVRCLREARAIGGETILSGSKFEMRLKLFEQIYESWTHPEGIAASLQEVLEAADDSAHDLGIRDDYLPLIAQLYAEFRQYEAALQVLNPLLHNADGSMTPVAHGNLGLFAPLAEVLCAMKDPDDASRLINQVMEVHEAQHTNAASPPAEYLRIRGTTLTEAGKLEAGEQALRGALSHPLGAPDQRLGPHQRVRSLAPLAWNLARQQRFEEANALLREALTLAAQSELREADEPKVLQSAAAVAGAGGEWHRAMDYCLRDRTHYPNSARTLLLRCLFAEEQAFENNRRGFLQAVADSEDRLVLSGLLRASALRPADASEPFLQFLPKLVDRLQGRLSDSSPIMQDELRLALAGAARLVGNGPAMEHWADQVSPNDALLHGQARLLQGIALQGQGRASEAAAALRTAEALVPFLAEASPDLAGARWEDRLRCRLLQQELHRCLAGTNDVAPAETAPGQ